MVTIRKEKKDGVLSLRTIQLKIQLEVITQISLNLKKAKRMLDRLKIKNWPISRGGCLKKQPHGFFNTLSKRSVPRGDWLIPNASSSFVKDRAPQIIKEPELAIPNLNYPRTRPCRRTGKGKEAQPTATKDLPHGSGNFERKGMRLKLLFAELCSLNTLLKTSTPVIEISIEPQF